MFPGGNIGDWRCRRTDGRGFINRMEIAVLNMFLKEDGGTFGDVLECTQVEHILGRRCNLKERRLQGGVIGECSHSLGHHPKRVTIGEGQDVGGLILTLVLIAQRKTLKKI